MPPLLLSPAINFIYGPQTDSFEFSFIVIMKLAPDSHIISKNSKKQTQKVFKNPMTEP